MSSFIQSKPCLGHNFFRGPNYVRDLRPATPLDISWEWNIFTENKCSVYHIDLWTMPVGAAHLRFPSDSSEWWTKIFFDVENSYLKVLPRRWLIVLAHSQKHAMAFWHFAPANIEAGYKLEYESQSLLQVSLYPTEKPLFDPKFLRFLKPEPRDGHSGSQPEFTFSAISLGLVIGCLICFTNLSLGLQSGWISMYAQVSLLSRPIRLLMGEL